MVELMRKRIMENCLCLDFIIGPAAYSCLHVLQNRKEGKYSSSVVFDLIRPSVAKDVGLDGKK